MAKKSHKVKQLRISLGSFCLYLSALFKFLGTFVLPGKRHIPVTILPLPGWWIQYKDIVYQDLLPKDSGLVRGFTREYSKMPEAWCNQLDELKKKDQNEC